MRYVGKIVVAIAIFGIALASAYQLPTAGFKSGTGASSSGYTLAYSVVPAEFAGTTTLAGSYSSTVGLAATYGDVTAPTISAVAVVSAMTVYNVDDVFQISFDISKTLVADPTVKISGRTATLMSKTSSNYTYQLPVVYDGTSSNPVVVVSGMDLDGNLLQVTQTVTAVVVDTTLQAPTNFTGYYDTPNHTYRLSWTNMPNENGYVLEVKLGTYPWTIFDTLAKDTTAYADTSFLEGVQTLYRIKAIYNQGAGNVDESLFNTLASSVFIPLAAPVVAVGTYDKDQRQVNISWTAGSPSTYEYLIKRSVNGGTYADLVTVAATQTAYTDTTVDYGKTYQYQIIARNQFGGQSNPQAYQPVNAGRVPIPAGADYHYEVLGTTGQDATDSGKINLVRNMDGSVVGYMNIDAAALGINLMTASLNMVAITRNQSTGLLQFDVPTATALASAVNNDATHTKKVPVTFTGLPTNKIPIIYVNGKAVTDANLQVKPEYADYVHNIVWNDTVGILTFDITHFSTYTIGLVNSVSFTQPIISQPAGTQAIVGILVRDNLGDAVENAPVLVKIESGAALFLGGGTQLTVSTNASGMAYVTTVLPATTGNISVLSATVDGVTANPICQVIVGNGTIPSLDSDHDGMPDVWETAHSFNPNDPADAALDADNDGLTNVQEYRRGTDPHIVDTDHDGVDDGHDAYPLNASLFQFNGGLVHNTVAAASFSGTAVDTPINSYAADIVVSYPQGSTNGSTSGVSSITGINVQKVSGLAYPRIEDGGLGEQYIGNMYTGLMPGQQYALRYKFLNRGNGTNTYQVQSSLQQTGTRWSINTPTTVAVAPWQVAAVNIIVAPDASLAMEVATLNVSMNLSLDTAVQYSIFTGAYTGGTYNNEGVYGGVQGIAYQTYILQAEGYNVNVINRTINIVNPNGVTVDATNVVPGARIMYTIVLRNYGNATASDVIFSDKVPLNCHLYYSDIPTVNGAVSATWEGATSNAVTHSDSNAVRFRLTLMPQTAATLSYTVTVD